MSVQTLYSRMIFFFFRDYVPKAILKTSTKKQPMNPKSLDVKKELLATLLGKEPNMVYYSFSKDKQNKLIPGHTLVLLRQVLSEYHRLV